MTDPPPETRPPTEQETNAPAGNVFQQKLSSFMDGALKTVCSYTHVIALSEENKRKGRSHRSVTRGFSIQFIRQNSGGIQHILLCTFMNDRLSSPYSRPQEVMDL